MKRANKYSAVKKKVGKHTFDSTREANRYKHLKRLEQQGLIEELTLQDPFTLTLDNGTPILIRSKGYPNGRKARYVVDFVYFDYEKDAWVYEDVKGFDTPLSRLKRAIVETMYDIRIDVIK